MIKFPDNLDKRAFLKKYWQQRPLLLTGVMANASQLINHQKLFALSTSDEIESRLLLEHGPDEPWQVFHGPQKIEQIESLNHSTHWTLLVQSVNLWHKGCAKLLRDFDFIPQWRLDDIMISYATESGSVGPHVDHYDVFLIQLTGTRRWIVGEMDAKVEKQDPDSSSQHIKPYPAIIDTVLNAGDMLYIPPNTAHHGISIEPGMTLSVGFRSPALSEMMMIFAEQLMLDKAESYYCDPLINDQHSSTEISSAAMTKAVHWFSHLEQLDDQKRKAFGLLQTQPKQELILSPLEFSVAETINRGHKIRRDPAARMAWYRPDQESVWLFINGEFYQRPDREIPLIKRLGRTDKITKKKFLKHYSDEKSSNLLQIFVDSGMFGIK